MFEWQNHYATSFKKIDSRSEQACNEQAPNRPRRDPAVPAWSEEVGCQILATDYQFIFPSKLTFFRPAERWLSKLPLDGQYLILAQKPI